jgi:hypothetical protein
MLPAGSGERVGPAVCDAAALAMALARLNEDFFDLDINSLQLLIVECVNVFDPTRARPLGDGMAVENTRLQGLCKSANSLERSPRWRLVSWSN